MTLHWGDDALAVPCPRCGAGAGLFCRSTSPGKGGHVMRGFHPDRCKARLRVGNDDALDTVARWVAHGYSHAAIASMYGLPEAVVSSVADRLNEGRRPVLTAKNRSRLLAAPVAPTAGYVPALGTMRRLRALTRIGHGISVVTDHTGLGIGTLSDIQSGRQRRVLAVVAAGVRYAYERLDAGPSWRAAQAAREAGWPPRSAWTGLDMDDPEQRPDGFPHCDRPHVLRRYPGTRRSSRPAPPTDARLGAASPAVLPANEAAPGAGTPDAAKGLREGGRPEPMMTDATDNLNGDAPTSRRTA